MSGILIPWPTHRRSTKLLGALFEHVRDTLPADDGRDLIALAAAMKTLVEVDPTAALKLDAEFKRMRR